MGVVHNKSAIDKLREEIQKTNTAVGGNTSDITGLSGDVATLENTVNGNGETTFGLVGDVSGLNTWKGSFAPNAKTVILASSTEASEKQFAITVNDSGTITATEVVASE